MSLHVALRLPSDIRRMQVMLCASLCSLLMKPWRSANWRTEDASSCECNCDVLVLLFA